MSEKLRGDAVPADAGPGHQEQAPLGAVPSGDLPAVRRPETVFPAQLALLPSHVPVPPQEPRSSSFASGAR